MLDPFRSDGIGSHKRLPEEPDYTIRPIEPCLSQAKARILLPILDVVFFAVFLTLISLGKYYSNEDDSLSTALIIFGIIFMMAFLISLCGTLMVCGITP